MANTIALAAEKRRVSGRKVKTLRKEGILPANVYGKKVKSLAVQVSRKDFEKTLADVGETGIVELNLGKEKRPVLIHSVQLDPVTDTPIHADFLQVNLKEKVTATVPVELTGESPIEKSGEGVLVQQMNEIEVEALPVDLPEKITVDISGLEKVDDAIKVAQLPVDKEKVEVQEDPERIVVSITEPSKEEEPVPAPEAEVVEGEEAEAAEGEAPAEGEEKAPEEGAKPAEGVEEPEQKGKGKPQPQGQPQAPAQAEPKKREK